MFPLIEMSLWIEALGTAITSSFSKDVTPSSPSAASEQKLVSWYSFSHNITQYTGNRKVWINKAHTFIYRAQFKNILMEQSFPQFG